MQYSVHACTHMHTHIHWLHVYKGVSGACVEWIYVAGVACVDEVNARVYTLGKCDRS